MRNAPLILNYHHYYTSLIISIFTAMNPVPRTTQAIRLANFGNHNLTDGFQLPSEQAKAWICHPHVETGEWRAHTCEGVAVPVLVAGAGHAADEGAAEWDLPLESGCAGLAELAGVSHGTRALLHPAHPWAWPRAS